MPLSISSGVVRLLPLLVACQLSGVEPLAGPLTEQLRPSARPAVALRAPHLRGHGGHASRSRASLARQRRTREQQHLGASPIAST